MIFIFSHFSPKIIFRAPLVLLEEMDPLVTLACQETLDNLAPLESAKIAQVSVEM